MFKRKYVGRWHVEHFVTRGRRTYSEDDFYRTVRQLNTPDRHPFIVESYRCKTLDNNNGLQRSLKRPV